MATDAGEREGAPLAKNAQFDVRLEIPQRPEASLPALTLSLTENRSGGWLGSVKINPRMLAAGDALQVLLHDGLVPGTAVLVKLLIAGETRYAGAEIRIWPSVVTSVQTSGSQHVNEPEAICVVTFSDPLTYLGDRPIWTAFKDCPLGKMLGGALSSAAGGDGRPTSSPVLPGLPRIRIGEELRDEVAEIRYAIAAGEPLGDWLTRVYGRLGVRLSMVGDGNGTLHVALCDGVPSSASLNRDGGLDMTLDPSREPSATNLALSALAVNSPAIARGGLMDSALAGGPQRFGPNGAVASVLNDPQPSADEAARRAGFRQANRRLAQTQATVTSCQPGLLPGRVVNLKSRDPLVEAAHPPNVPGDARNRRAALLGASRWQVGDVAHLCLKARYWNRASFEKTGMAWRPDLPEERGATVVSGVVDDGASAPGEFVKRDRMGRVPIRLSFFLEPAVGSSDAPAASADIPWPPRVPLAPVAPGAGNLHGFVADHRQGDWCRIAVVNPLFAEIIGYSHRDDRRLGERVRDATVGIVMHESQDEWHGMLFRADVDPGD